MARRLLPLLLLAAAAAAGGGPETTLVVVNARSPVSRRVALAYQRLRDVPPSHVVHLDGVPHQGVVDLDTFRERLWGPVRAHMEALGAAGRIEYVAWSADLPYAVDFRPRKDGDNFAHASLNGLAFLIGLVEKGEEFWDLQVNPYYRIEYATRRATAEERALAMEGDQMIRDKRYAEAAEAYEKLLATYPQSANSWYNYACALALLRRTDDALTALRRAAEEGFRNAQHAGQDPDLASLRGDARFEAALELMREGAGVPLTLLPAQGFRAGRGSYLSTHLGYTGRFGNSLPEILSYLEAAAASDGRRPEGTVYFCRNGDVRSKTREPFWPALEAALKERGRKAELIEGVLPAGREDVLGAVIGAAGFAWGPSKSRILGGAIVEHLTSHGANFSTPGQTKLSEILRYGAAGASGTVHEPYALHPKFPNPLLHAFYADGCSLAEAFYQSLWGPYQLMIVGDGLARPFAAFTDVAVVSPPPPWKGVVKITGGTELWVDGRRVAEGGTYDLDTRELADGWHDVRVVHVADDAIRTRSWCAVAATVDNRGLRGRVTVRDGEVVIGAKGAREYRLGPYVSADGRFRPGAGRYVPVAVFPEGEWWGEALDVEPAPEWRKPVEGAGPFFPGARVTAGEKVFLVPSLGDRHAGLRLRDVVGAEGPLWVEAQFEAPRDGFYQLVLDGTGKVEVFGETVELGPQAYVPLRLRAGWHELGLRYEPEGKPDLEVMLGGDQVLDAPGLRHAHFAGFLEKPKVDDALGALLDGKRDGKGVPVPPEGLVLSFKRPVRDVAAVVLFPGRDARALPLEWQVEVEAGYRKWRSVKDLRVTAARPARTGKDEPEVPSFLELSFAPERTKRLRLTLKGEALLADVTVLGKPER